MDKQEAINFITLALNKGQSQEEISTALSQRIGAPPNIVAKFVAQMAATYQTPPPLTPSQPPSDSSTIPLQPYNPTEDLTPVKQDTAAEPQTPQAETIASMETETQPPATSENKRHPIAKDDPALEKMILRSLSKNRRRSNIVIAVCEHTHISYDEAQRLVAQISTKNRRHLTSRQNIILIPFAIALILAGLTLLYAAGNEMVVLGTDLADIQSDIAVDIQYTGETLRFAPFYFLLGLGFLLGGGIGLFRALQSQFE